MWRKCRTYYSELLMYRKQGEHLTGIHLLIAGFSWAPGRLFLAGWPVSWAVQAQHSRHTSWVQLANLFPWVILILLTRDGAAQQIPPLQLWSDDMWSWQYLHQWLGYELLNFIFFFQYLYDTWLWERIQESGYNHILSIDHYSA